MMRGSGSSVVFCVCKYKFLNESRLALWCVPVELGGRNVPPSTSGVSVGSGRNAPPPHPCPGGLLGVGGAGVVSVSQSRHSDFRGGVPTGMSEFPTS